MHVSREGARTMYGPFDARHYALPDNRVSFETDDAALERLYRKAESACGVNRCVLNGKPFLREGGGYGNLWLETQPMGGAMYAARDPETAKELAEELNSANQERQALSQKIFEEAERQLAKQGPPEWSLVLGEEGWHPGVIGIVASRMTEKYHLPSVLLSIDGETAKGSCRSIPPLDLYQALDRCRDHLVQFGGHAQAAGLTIRTAEIPAFREAFARVVAEMLDHKPYEPAAVPDWFVPEDREITPEAVAQLAQMEPFGVKVVLIEPGATRTAWGAITADHLEACTRGTVYEAPAAAEAGMVRKTFAGKMFSDPAVVTRAICRAVQARRPRARYVVAAGSWTMVFWHAILPTRWWDGIVRLLGSPRLARWVEKL